MDKTFVYVVSNESRKGAKFVLTVPSPTVRHVVERLAGSSLEVVVQDKDKPRQLESIESQSIEVALKGGGTAVVSWI
ncbi:hypothetical protein H4R18_001481 [Coemansia javaensis]|uniref:Uncharacterized protein n=1 Tax=Coemansia javaensis TaxID=2761396 RepID=A0A9W8HKG0_9FUNG|nr:hypothetical protein H4R18_001481 [Coemansia javaensis]